MVDDVLSMQLFEFCVAKLFSESDVDFWIRLLTARENKKMVGKRGSGGGKVFRGSVKSGLIIYQNQ